MAFDISLHFDFCSDLRDTLCELVTLLIDLGRAIVADLLLKILFYFDGFFLPELGIELEALNLFGYYGPFSSLLTLNSKLCEIVYLPHQGQHHLNQTYSMYHQLVYGQLGSLGRFAPHHIVEWSTRERVSFRQIRAKWIDLVHSFWTS